MLISMVLAAVASIWVQFVADGTPHVRAIVPNGPCPALVVGATSTPLVQRAAPAPGFPDTVCDAPLPADAHGARVDATVLPAIPRAPRTIAVFADTGCRLKGSEVQACNDPRAWPFATIAADIAAAHPDLAIHVGDYYYRETPCPDGVNCANSPHGDNAAAWEADYFAPMRPLFAVAPLVNVRGNHEDCKRSPLGWARYLSGQVSTTCSDHEPVGFIAFDQLTLGVVDDASETAETLPDPAVFETDEAQVDGRAVSSAGETWLLVHRPPLLYEATHHDAAGGVHLAAVISGHIHTFGAYTFPGEPPQLITGMGGDNLASDTEVRLLDTLGGVTDRRFGYAIFTHRGDGWDVVVHDTTSAVHRRCRLEARAVRCGPPMT
jgi:hypothetical protein